LKIITIIPLSEEEVNVYTQSFTRLKSNLINFVKLRNLNHVV